MLNLSYEVTEGFRLSPQQKRLWSLQTAQPGAEFGVQGTVWIYGRISVAGIDEAIIRCARRHEILRTRFACLSNTAIPVQIVNDAAHGLSRAVDCRQCSLEPHSAAANVAREEWRRLGELGPAGTFSFVLVTLSDEEHLLVITASGLCADATSLINLIREIQAECPERESESAEILQYADLAEWQNQLIENGKGEEQVPYWNSADCSSLGFPQFPFRLHSDAITGTFHPQVVQRAIRCETVNALERMAQQARVPLAVVLLTAWEMLLQRFCGREAFLIGTSLEGRSQDQLRGVVGPLVKFLPLKVQMDRNSEFFEWLHHVNHSLQIAEYDQFLFGSEAIGNPAQRRCLWPVLFSSRLQPSLKESQTLNWEMGAIREQLEPFELQLDALIGAERIQLNFHWDTSVFQQIDIELLADAYAALLQEIAEKPDRPADEFTMCAPVAASVLFEPVEPELPWLAVHELIASHARRVPQQLAVICGDERLTYAELDHRAGLLAARLIEAGIGADSVVALVARRSIHFVVGMLAALKAGAAWLPMEPETPPERASYMMTQSRARAILAQREFPLANAETLPIIYLDEQWSGTESKLLPSRAVHPQQIAYVIFTSGSTGRPKCIAVEHHQIAAYVRALSARVDLSASRHFALVSSTAADLGHTVVFGALTSGGCLHIIPEASTLDADALARYFLEYPIDFIKIVPAHLEALCRAFAESTRLPWRYVFAGGELLTRRLVRTVEHLAPSCVVFNHYGPTETTVGVFCGRASDALLFDSPNVPIGRPFMGTSAYLLDEKLKPVPTWTPGELYIGGDFVSRGYVGAGDLTAERFLPDPFRCLPGSRMYRTGDLARYRSDGLVEFLGRRDGQVKIRGYRVEMGEIEAVLCAHPAVRNAAVVVMDDEWGNKSLAAWVAVGAARLTPEEVQSFLEKSLPPYMVPRRLVCVEQLKLTSNGKVDRQSLPAIAPVQALTRHSQPLDEVEEKLLAIWQAVLNVEHISIEDNYFSLGGDSLRVIQLVQQARRYGIAIAATDVLRHQTIRRLRKALQQTTRQGLFPDGVPALPPPSMELMGQLPADMIDCYPLTGLQSFMLEKYRQNEGSQGIYHIQDCLHMRDPRFSLQALDKAFHAMVDRHPVLRTVFYERDGQTVQVVRSNLQWKMGVEDISGLDTARQEKSIAEALLKDRATLFDAADLDAPLFRVVVFQRAHDEFNVMFSCHHAIMDGWGHRELLNQVMDAYAAIKEARKPQLGEPDSTYREFVAFQEAVRRSEKASAYWRVYLSGIEPHVHGSEEISRPGQEETEILRSIDPALADALVRTAREGAISLQALTLAVWLEALRQWSNRDVVMTGVVTNGRSEYLTDPLSAVGLFWNIVAVVSRRSLPLLAQAASVQNDLIESDPYSAYPLPQLIADHGGHELFFSVFRYLNFWNTKELPATSELQLLEMRAHDRYSFPLTCSVLISPFGRGGLLHFGFDPARISAERVYRVCDICEALLKKVTEK